ncbi:MAG: thiol:disulfide interchange protein DsbA/DsbL [Steroidobacteraceae bacterium]
MINPKIQACLLLAMLLSACGGGGEAPGQESSAPVAQATDGAPPAAEPAAPVAAPQAKPEDGETVDEVTSSVSPIAQAVAATTPAPTAGLPSRWQQGKHFTALPAAQPVSVAPGQVEVTEIFWYGCGHCFTLEPQLEAWERGAKPDYVKVVRLPVVWNEVTREDARLFYTLEALGKVEALQLAVFRELHVNRRPLTIVAGNRVDTAATEKRVREFLAGHGVTAEQFGGVYRSFAVESKIRQAENLARRYRADHTPMAVVQGKYITDVSMAGGVEPLMQLLTDLAVRERSAR